MLACPAIAPPWLKVTHPTHVAVWAAQSPCLYHDQPGRDLFSNHSVSPTGSCASCALSYTGGTLHTVAVKANPVGKVLQVFKDCDMGAEVRCSGTCTNCLFYTIQKPNNVA